MSGGGKIKIGLILAILIVSNMTLISLNDISASSATSYNSTADFTAPTIKNTDPSNKATNVAVNKVIKVKFRESIKEGNGWIELKKSSGKSVAFTTSVSGNVLIIKPTTNLTKRTKYTLTMHSGCVTDLSGNRYVYTGIKTFTTDGKAPTIKYTNPKDNAVSVAVNKTIKVTFSEYIKMGSGWIEFKDSRGISAPFNASIRGKVLTVTPISNLTQGVKYALIIHSGSVTDLSGNGYAYAGCTDFTTYSNYLISTPNCQVNDSQIKALAAKITRGKISKYEKAVRIFNWVRDNIKYSYYYNTKYGALGTLSKRIGDCCDMANLLVALERAAGIPARYEHVKAKFRNGHWYGHVIAQVYMKGKWYYADAISSKNSLGVINNWNTATATIHGTYAILPF